LANKQQAVGDSKLRSPDKSKKQKGKFSTDDVIGTDVKPTPHYSPSPRRSAPSVSQTASSSQSSDTGSLPLRAPIRTNSSGSDSPSTADQQTLAITPGNQPSFSQQDRIRLNAIKEQQTNMDPLVLQKSTVAPMTNNSLTPAFTVLNSSLSRQSRYNQSTDNLERSIAADIDALGASHPTVANDLTNLAQIKIADGKYAEARGLLYKAIPIYEKAYGLNNALTINAVSSLAYVEGQSGNTDLALTLYKKALAAGQAVLGPNSLEIARILNEMAHLFYSQGKLPEARTYYEWAVASTQAAVGDHDALLAACLRDYAQVLRTMGDENEASAIELRAKKIALAPANQ
jgi:tetratricopeptide (TPR) repeat protein